MVPWPYLTYLSLYMWPIFWWIWLWVQPCGFLNTLYFFGQVWADCEVGDEPHSCPYTWSIHLLPSHPLPHPHGVWNFSVEGVRKCFKCDTRLRPITYKILHPSPDSTLTLGFQRVSPQKTQLLHLHHPHLIRNDPSSSTLQLGCSQ